MEDPYKVLGIQSTASTNDIRKAYRKLAKQCHPDLHPGDVEAEAKFKEISNAYALLSDPDKRARYDADEIDAEGNERPSESFYRSHAGSSDGARYSRYDGQGTYDHMSDIFSDLFRHRHAEHDLNIRGHDLRYSIDIPFIEAARGTTKTVTMADGKTLKINIPEGTKNRDTLRLRGEGMPGLNQGPPGDAYIDVNVINHPVFAQHGIDIHLSLPITISEAVLGGKIKVPTIEGVVEMTIPKGSNTGTTLRLKGRGVRSKSGQQKGHQYVRLEIMLPEPPDTALIDFAKASAKSDHSDPRAQLLEMAK